MTGYVYIGLLLALGLLASCWDLAEHPLLDDPDLQHDPTIVTIDKGTDQNVRLILDYGYSAESSVLLERKTVGGFENIAYRRQSQTTLVDTTVDKETDADFVYRVRVEKNGFQTAYSPEREFSYESLGLNEPADLQLQSIELQGVRLSWQDRSRREEGYLVEKDEGSGFQEIGRVGVNSTGYVDAIAGVPPVVLQLRYRVRAYNSAKTSMWVEGRTMYAGIGSPTNLRIVDPTSYRFTLEWDDNSSIETGYAVERSRDGGGFEEVREVGANETQYVDVLTELGEYTYRVRARKDEVYSVYSNEVSHNVVTVVPPGVVRWEVNDGGNGHFYKAVLVPEGISWPDADEAAKAMGDEWHLVTITSAEENEFVYSLVSGDIAFWQLFPGGNNEGPWLGGLKVGSGRGDYGWVTGEPFTYSNWGPNEPFGNGDRIGFFGHQASMGLLWNDVPASRLEYGYIIENSTTSQ